LKASGKAGHPGGSANHDFSGFESLPQNLERWLLKFRSFIEKQNAVMGQ
jgi:hypothetical protein